MIQQTSSTVEKLDLREIQLPDATLLEKAPPSFNRAVYALAAISDFLRGGTTKRFASENGVVDDPAPGQSIIPGMVLISEKHGEHNSHNAISILKNEAGKAQLFYVETRLIATQDFGVMVGEYSQRIKPLESKHLKNFDQKVTTEELKALIKRAYSN